MILPYIVIVLASMLVLWIVLRCDIPKTVDIDLLKNPRDVIKHRGLFNFSWVFFRARDMDSALKVLSSMLDYNSFFVNNDLKEILRNINGNSSTLIYISVCFVIVIMAKNTIRLKSDFSPNKFYMFWTLFLLTFSVFSLEKNTEFLYFNF